MGNICPAKACFYIEPLKNYKALKLTMFEKYAKMQHISPYVGAPRNRPLLYILESSRRADVKL